jgi:hypothetical protein
LAAAYRYILACSEEKKASKAVVEESEHAEGGGGDYGLGEVND